ncbi:MAG: TIGR02449 family protein [Gammaproteobacteria bacterium]|nr:TIGR02449 family protein [Gammaproteobacteria bacterium]
MQEPQGLHIETLETRVDELIRAIEQLSGENKALRTQRSGLMAERAALIEKTELARSRVESMITRLKAMES